MQPRRARRWYWFSTARVHIVVAGIKNTIVILTLVLLTTCSQAAPDTPLATTETALLRDTDAAFQTDHLSYTLSTTPSGLEGEIAFVFTNRTDGPVFFVNCNGATVLTLEKQIGSRWVRAWEPVVPACLSPPITVDPGQEYRGVVHMFSGYPGTNFEPKFAIDPIPGVYRIVWRDVLQTYDHDAQPHGETLPAEQRTSNRFRLDHN